MSHEFSPESRDLPAGRQDRIVLFLPPDGVERFRHPKDDIDKFITRTEVIQVATEIAISEGLVIGPEVKNIEIQIAPSTNLGNRQWGYSIDKI